jgi:beta-lactamase class A
MNLLSKRGRGRGPREVEHILKAYSSGVFRQTKIVELIPSGGKSYKNLASAHDYSRFLYALWHDNFPYSAELRRLMSLPNNDRIFKGARRIPNRTDVYDKTGTTARLCGNMGILVARGRNGRQYPYTLIGIIEKKRRTRNLTRWINSRGDVIREVSNKVYLHMRSIHSLA